MSHTPFRRYLESEGIVHRHTTRATPQSNRISERAQRDIGEGVVSALAQSGLPDSLWSEAARAFVYVTNRLPGKRSGKQTPHELWYGNKPNVSRLRTWGCVAYVHVQKDQCNKLQPHTRKCAFVGYPEDYKAWKFWDPATRKIIISRDAIFDENSFLYAPKIAPSFGCLVPAPMPAPVAPPVAAAAPRPPPARPPAVYVKDFDDLEAGGVLPDAPRPAAPPAPRQPSPAPSAHSEHDDFPPLPPAAPAARPVRVRPPAPPPIVRPQRPQYWPRDPGNANAPLILKDPRHPVPLHQLGVPQCRVRSQSHSAPPEPLPRRAVSVQVPPRAPPAAPASPPLPPAVGSPLLGQQLPPPPPIHPRNLPSHSPSPPLPPTPQSPPAVVSDLELDSGTESDDPINGPTAEEQAALPAFAGIDTDPAPPEWPEMMEYAYAALDQHDPKSYKQAMGSKDHDKWTAACVDKINAHIKNGTWKLVELPADRSAVGSCWVFRVKHSEDSWHCRALQGTSCCPRLLSATRLGLPGALCSDYLPLRHLRCLSHCHC